MFVIVMAFIVTNIDGFAALAAQTAVSTPERWRRNAAEAAAAFALLVVACLLAALALSAIPVGNVAWLGIVPAAIGLGKVIAAFGKQQAEMQSASMAGVVFATGIDNVALYVPLFALLGIARASAAGLGYVLVFGIIAAAIAYLAPNVVRLRPYRRYVDAALGCFFIAIGVSMLMHALA
jgi:cadmium resistance protein CadD (predicted permease)